MMSSGCRPICKYREWRRAAAMVFLTVFLLGARGAGAEDEPGTKSAEPEKNQVQEAPAQTLPRSLPNGKRRPHDVVLEADSLTFRPTVLVRRGTSQGSGTIIASIDAETLVLTASHVVRGTGQIQVELHRYNLGLERASTQSGLWPRHVSAECVATDAAADIAVLRLRNMVALPYVARLGSADDEPRTTADVTSVGIDMGSKLSSWKTRLVDIFWFELNDSGNERPFLVTAKIPEHGRSGGGLFDADGTLVGVCVGHAEMVQGRRMGVFSSIESVRKLLGAHDLASVVSRSEARHPKLGRNSSATVRHLGRPTRSGVTSTDARGERVIPPR
jgi:S1-C subfamily serine protease